MKRAIQSKESSWRILLEARCSVRPVAPPSNVDTRTGQVRLQRREVNILALLHFTSTFASQPADERHRVRLYASATHS